MRLYLINPSNPYVSIIDTTNSRWNRFRVWKPLSLLAIAGLTPSEWDITIIDENVTRPDYAAMPAPDLVGITAFTSQANRAYEIASIFRKMDVPVVMGGIHATMRYEEAISHVDAIVTGEAEGVWRQVLEDVRDRALKSRYTGGLAEINAIKTARHDLLSPRDYAFGSIQTTRGCPLKCNFCSVTAFNGTRYRMRPIQDVIEEFSRIQEKRILIVDDNLIGIRSNHISRTKRLFQAMISAGIQKEWIAQVTINFADDEELLDLAYKAGCRGVFIGFESATAEGLKEIKKKFNARNGRDFPASVKRIQKHRIVVVGGFIIGLDSDKPGIGKQVAKAARHYGVDNLNALFLTPLPGTELWSQMEAENRIPMSSFPEDWSYYTLTYPVARYKNMTQDSISEEMLDCDQTFYSIPNITRRLWSSVVGRRQPLINLVTNLSYRKNSISSQREYALFKDYMGDRGV